MTDGTQFSIEPESADGFYIIVSRDLTVYEQYNDAVAEIQSKVATDTDCFLAEVTIDNIGSEDIAISLEQIGWQQIIQDMAASEGPN